MSARRRFLVLASVLSLLPAFVLAGPVVTPDLESSSSPRNSEPVVLFGAAFPELLGERIDRIRLYRVNNSAGGFEAIPFQVDERLLKLFNQGSEFEFTEMVYDILHEEDGLIDANDEIAFMYRDAGVRAPEQLPWPEGAGPLRYEIAIEDPRPGSSAAPQWVYLYVGGELELSPESYISWNGLASAVISSDRYELTFEGNWLFTEYRVLPPCGDGSDLIDRFKGRAQPLEANREDEEAWSFNSSFLGGLLGPIRAIRYVRGASSGVNTIHHDVIYESYWKRHINLRVHALIRIWFYFDWLPDTELFFFSPEKLEGVTIDGLPDGDVGEQVPAWQVISGPGGGFGIVWDVPDSPLYTAKQHYYVDDAGFNDQISSNPVYGDDDDSAYGAHGVVIEGIEEANTTAIPFSWRIYPSCAGDGDGQLGQVLNELREYPLQPDPEPQWSQATLVRTLTVGIQGDDTRLEWQSLSAMDGYRVYRSDEPERSQESWTELGDTTDLFFLDQGEAPLPGSRYYSVVALTPGGGEGGW